MARSGSPYRYLAGSLSLSPHTCNPPQRFLPSALGALSRLGANVRARDIHEPPFSYLQLDPGYGFVVEA